MLKNCTRAARVSWFAEKYSAKTQFISVKVDKVFEYYQKCGIKQVKKGQISTAKRYRS